MKQRFLKFFGKVFLKNEKWTFFLSNFEKPKYFIAKNEIFAA